MIASVYRLRHAVPRFPQTLQIQDNSAFRVCSGDQILPRAMRQTIASILAAAFVASANEARAVPSPNASSIQRSIILIEAWILKELSVVGLLLLWLLLTTCLEPQLSGEVGFGPAGRWSVQWWDLQLQRLATAWLQGIRGPAVSDVPYRKEPLFQNQQIR